jgi:hypothetical protein
LWWAGDADNTEGLAITLRSELIDLIGQRFSAGGYKVSRDVSLPDGTAATLTASRTYFSWKGLVVLSQHIVARELDSGSAQDMQDLFEAGFRFGKRANRVPLLRGMQFGYMIIPVVIGVDPDSSLVEYVAGQPRKHWSLFEYPVLVDLRNRQTIHFKGTPIWGAFFFSDMRRLVEEYIASSVASETNTAGR